MNIWAVIAIIAAMVFGGCVGYIVAYYREKKHVSELLDCCKETSDQLAKLSKEYDEFVKAANDLDRWPKHNSHIVMKENLADYLKNKYLTEERSSTESDNLYI